MNLATRIKLLEKVHGDAKGAKFPAGFVLTAQEHAALALSGWTFFSATYDVEYAPRATAFMRLYGESRPARQIDPMEMAKAMRNTVHGDASEIAADRQRYRALMDSVFERCGFNLILKGTP